MNSRGRKKKVYDNKVLIQLIEDFLEEQGKLTTIKYKAIFNFCNDKYENGKFSYKLSEEFWRREGRQGRKLIDEYNLQIIPTGLKKTAFTVINTANIVNSLSNDTPKIKEKIINTLKVNELGYLKLIEKYNKLLEKQASYQNEIALLIEEKNKLIEHTRVYEEVLFQWADLSTSKDIPLVNTMTTGKTQSKVVKQLFQEMFSENSNEPFININNSTKDNNKIIDIETITKKNTLISDFDL